LAQCAPVFSAHHGCTGYITIRFIQNSGEIFLFKTLNKQPLVAAEIVITCTYAALPGKRKLIRTIFCVRLHGCRYWRWHEWFCVNVGSRHVLYFDAPGTG